MLVYCLLGELVKEIESILTLVKLSRKLTLGTSVIFGVNIRDTLAVNHSS